MVDSPALVVGQGQAAEKLKLISYDFEKTIIERRFYSRFPFSKLIKLSNLANLMKSYQYILSIGCVDNITNTYL